MKAYPDLKLNFALAPKTEHAVHLATEVTPLLVDKNGPFIYNKTGEILCVNNRHAFISGDKGNTWQTHEIFSASDNLTINNSHNLVCCDDGSIIVSFIDINNYHFNWRKKSNSPTKNSYMYHYVIRSEDGGKTWQKPIRIQQGYAAAATTIIQLKSGALLLSAQNMNYDHARHFSLTFRSEDQGKTWQASNHLDIGGTGHHDGCYEGTLVELNDRVWYCIRTNLDYFWHAYSMDDGKTWTETTRGIEASSSPAMLKRLSDGRLLMVYNTLYPEGKDTFARRAGQFSCAAASWQREELVAIVSVDDGVSWSKPKVLAQCKGAWLSYPYIFEANQNEVWITTMQSELRIILNPSHL